MTLGLRDGEDLNRGKDVSADPVAVCEVGAPS